VEPFILLIFYNIKISEGWLIMYIVALLYDRVYILYHTITSIYTLSYKSVTMYIINYLLYYRFYNNIFSLL